MYRMRNGIIVANLVPLDGVLAGNYRPLTAQLVTFWRLAAFSVSAKLATIFSRRPELELFLGLIPHVQMSRNRLVMCAARADPQP